MAQPKLIVLDVRLPFRNEKDLKALPDEREAFRSRILDAQKNPKFGAALAQLITDHRADGIWLQAYHQDPQHPFVHAAPHLVRHFDFAGPGPVREPDQASGKSGQVVITAHFPAKDEPWTDQELAESTSHVVNHMEALGWIHEHCRDRGYRSINARGESYQDLDAVRHNSIAVFIAAVSVVAQLTVVQTVILIIISEPSVGIITPTTIETGRVPVTVNGHNFENGMTVLFNGHPVNYALVSKDQLTTDLSAPDSDPRIIVKEISKITVTTSVGSALSSQDVRLIPPPPTLTGFTPLSDVVGKPVDISGTHLLTSGVAVTFNGLPATFIIRSDNQITANVPAGSGTGPIRIVTDGGAVSSGTNFAQI